MQFKLTLLATSAACLSACTTPAVKYETVSTPLTKNEGTSAPTLFRVPRSLIKIDPDPKLPVASISSTVLDVLPVTDRTPLPGNPSLMYTLAVSHDRTGTISRTDFGNLDGETSGFPFPSCDTAVLTVYGQPGTQFTGVVTVVPTELAVVSQPSSSTGDVPYLPLYKAIPRDNFVSTTTTKLTYFGDSLIPKTVSSGTTDNIQTEVTAVSTIAAAVIPIALAAAPAGQQPPNAASLAQIARIDLTTADNNDLYLIPLPNKGTITAHQTCGADVSDSADVQSKIPQGMQDVGAMIKEVAAIYKQVKGGNSSASTTAGQ